MKIFILFQIAIVTGSKGRGGVVIKKFTKTLVFLIFLCFGFVFSVGAVPSATAADDDSISWVVENQSQWENGSFSNVEAVRDNLKLLRGQWPFAKTLTQANGNVTSVSISSKGNYIAYSSGENVFVHSVGGNWSLLTTLTQANGNVNSVAISPDENYIAYGSEDENVYVHHLDIGWTLENTLSELSVGVDSIDFSENYIIYGGLTGKSIWVHKASNDFPVVDNPKVRDYDTGTRAVAFSKNDRHAAFESHIYNSTYKHSIRVYRWSNNGMEGWGWFYEPNEAVTSIDFSPYGDLVSYSSEDNKVYLTELEGGSLENILHRANNSVNSVDLSLSENLTNSYMAYASDDDNVYIHVPQFDKYGNHWTAWHDFGFDITVENLKATTGIESGENVFVNIQVDKNGDKDVEDNYRIKLENGTKVYSDFSSLESARFVRIKTVLETENQNHTPQVNSFKLSVTKTPASEAVENLYVDNDWLDKSNIPSNLTYGDNAFYSIENAVDFAGIGDNIVAKPGIYDRDIEKFPITVNVENLTLKSSKGLENTILNGEGVSEYILKITGLGVQFSGFTIENSEGRETGIGIEGYGSVVSNILTKNNWYGITISGGRSILVENSIIENNLYTGIWFEGGASNNTIRNSDIVGQDEGSGISFWNWSNNNIIENNNISGNMDEGVEVTRESDNNVIRNNVISNNQLFGISVVSNSNVAKIVHNTIKYNDNGILLERKQGNNVIEGNDIENNYGYGILIREDENSRVVNNQVMKNKIGLELGGGVDNVKIAESSIENNENGIRLVGSFTDIVISSNNIENNSCYGIVNENPNVTVNAENNWWGDASGPSGVAPGDGDAVSENVDFDPWLDAPYPKGESIGFVDGFIRENVSGGSNEVDAVENADASVSMSVDAGISGTLSVGRVENNPGGPVPADFKGVGKYVSINTTAPTDNINWPVTVKIHYTDSEISGVDEDSLEMFHWNTSTQKWEKVSKTGIDSKNNYVWGEVNHLSTFTILGSSPATFTINDLSISPVSVSPGETVDISATVTNTGGYTGTYTAELKIDGTVVDQDSITLNGGESGTVSFQVSREEPGAYNVTLDDLSDSFEVLEPAEFEATNLDIEPSSPSPGQEVTISCTVRNVGEIEGDHYVTLKEDGRRVETVPVTLGPGQSRKVEFTMGNLTPGQTYEISVDGLHGEFTVKREAGKRRVPLTKEEPETPAIALLSLAISISVILSMLALIFRGRKGE